MSVKVVTKSSWKGDIIKVKGHSAMTKSIYEIGLIIEAQAKELCARRYGYLAASINTQFEGGGTELESPSTYAKETPPASHKVDTFRKIQKPGKEDVVLVGTAVDYAPHKEFGTVKMAADPFLRPAADLAQGKTLTVVKLNTKYYFGEYMNARDVFLEMSK
jgi:phage gpG-like protein